MEYTAQGTQEHLAWCKFFEILICYDMVDAGKLAAAEIGARKNQVIHDKWKHKLPRLNANTDAGVGDSHLLIGTPETRGNFGAAPSLRKWLGDKLAKETWLLRNGARLVKTELWPSRPSSSPPTSPLRPTRWWAAGSGISFHCLDRIQMLRTYVVLHLHRGQLAGVCTPKGRLRCGQMIPFEF